MPTRVGPNAPNALSLGDVRSEHSEVVLAGKEAGDSLRMIANLFEQKEYYKDALNSLRASNLELQQENERLEYQKRVLGMFLQDGFNKINH